MTGTRTSSPWTALLAPLGELSVDQRALAADPDAWTLRPHCPLLDLDTREVVGWVESLTVVDNLLMAAGYVYDPTVLDGMAPQLDLARVHEVITDGGAHHLMHGEIATVTLGTRPLWPDVWIRVDNPDNAAP